MLTGFFFFLKFWKSHLDIAIGTGNMPEKRKTRLTDIFAIASFSDQILRAEGIFLYL